MRVVAGRRALGASERGSSPAPRSDYDEDAPTTVSSAAEIEALLGSGDDVVASAAPPGAPAYDADTYIDDRDFDEAVPFAVGTRDRDLRSSLPPNMQLAPRTSASPPIGTGPFAYPAVYPTSAPFGRVGPMVETGPFVTGPYATGPFAYVTQVPYPVAPAPQAARSSATRTVAISVALVVTALMGVVVGKVLVSGSGQVAPAPQSSAAAPAPQAAVAAATTPAAAQPTPPVAPTVAPQPTAPAAASVPSAPAAPPVSLSLPIASIGHPAVAPVLTQQGGRVTRAFLDNSRRLRKNDKLFEIARRAPQGAASKQLAAKVKELEVMAEQDPIYKDFLEKARRDYKRSLGGRETTVLVKAPRAGMYQPAVSRGDHVEPNQAVANAVDADSWIATATVTDDAHPASDWTCSMQLDDRHADCRVVKIEDSKVSVRIEARKAAWLSGSGTAGTIVLEPPASAAAR